MSGADPVLKKPCFTRTLYLRVHKNNEVKLEPVFNKPKQPKIGPNKNSDMI